MSAHPPSDGTANLPSAAALLLCLLLVAAGYAMAIVRGPDPAQEVRVVTHPPPAPGPEAATE